MCSKVVAVAGQGIKALDTHAKGTKHIQRFSNSSTGKIPFTSSTNTVIASEPENAVKKVKQTLTVPLMENQSTKQAEVIWTLDVVLSKISFRSSDNKAELFIAMFPDSQIAQKVACGQTKCKYLVCHALARYFKELHGQTSEVEHFVCLFDESHNHVIKKGQMDLHVRFWDSTTKSVKTRYFNSKFLGKAAATDILKSFKSSMNGLGKEKLLHVSMDGPNVNTKFLSNLNEERRDQELSQLVSIETCGIHTVHNAFNNGENAGGWKLKTLLSSMFKIFRESPSRRADYELLKKGTRI